MAKVASWALMAGASVALSSTAATTMSACGESGGCSIQRQTEYASLEAWQSCDPLGPAGQCIIIAGNPKDCTGVLSCNFAVNARSRADAEQGVLTSGQQSVGCYLCATPSCIAVQMAVCEPVSRRCIGVSGTTSSGGLVFTGEDAGGGGGSSSSGGSSSGGVVLDASSD
jgi:hypothetical protein